MSSLIPIIDRSNLGMRVETRPGPSPPRLRVETTEARRRRHLRPAARTAAAQSGRPGSG